MFSPSKLELLQAKCKTRTIAFDADDVLLDCITFLHHCTQLAVGRPVQELVKDYYLVKRFGIHDHEVPLVFDKFGELLHKQPMFDGIKEVLLELKKMHYQIVVITAIDEIYKNGREKCFEWHGVKVDKVITTGEQGSKLKALEEVRPDFFFDDRLQNFVGIRCENMHKVWVEHAGEIQTYTGSHSGLYDEKTSSVYKWFTT